MITISSKNYCVAVGIKYYPVIDQSKKTLKLNKNYNNNILITQKKSLKQLQQNFYIAGGPRYCENKKIKNVKMKKKKTKKNFLLKTYKFFVNLFYNSLYNDNVQKFLFYEINPQTNIQVNQQNQNNNVRQSLFSQLKCCS
eukprot:TRINITY_DN17435_c0_g1_i2.p3 TRINITY_DN17435_c0_g1~~TRINITY_DN17435_c0_g1_i2.p3  ORF type:complete len:140 (+),score=3.25 TRINITY_DN17435_c0_g1_i2:659-1078(+)